MRLYNNYKKHNQYKTLLDLIALLFVFVIITFFVKNFFKPFLSIIILSIICRPIYEIFKRFINNDQISGALTLIMINVIIFCFVFYFGNSIITILQDIYIDNLDKIRDVISNIRIIFNIDMEQLLHNNSISLTSATFKNGLVVTGQSMLAYIIANIFVYFFLVDQKSFIKLINYLLPYNIIETIRIKKNNLKEVIKIEMWLVLLCMIMTIAGFLILRIPSSLFLGVICGLLDILPYVGTIIVFIPIIIYNIVMKKYLIVIGLIALYLLIQIVREILELKFLSSKLEIHPLVVMLAIYIGAEIFGIIGILVGPIYCLIAKDIIFKDTIQEV